MIYPRCSLIDWPGMQIKQPHISPGIPVTYAEMGRVELRLPNPAPREESHRRPSALGLARRSPRWLAARLCRSEAPSRGCCPADGEDGAAEAPG